MIKTEPFFVKLPNRAALHLEGADCFTFLQNAISNDLQLLQNLNSCLYTAILTPQGKFAYDVFIHKGGNDNGPFYILDCEGGERAEKLHKHLKLYKLRSDVQISIEDDHPVYATLHTDTVPSDTAKPDPRHPLMGYRSFEKPADIEERAFDEWDKHRIRLGVPDGSRDIVVAKDNIIDCNLDKLNGVSFEKGCYIGQEITARMHLRGLSKKHLTPIQSEHPFPEPFADLVLDGKLYGQMRSSNGDIGIIMLKNDLRTTLPEGYKIIL